MPQESSACRLQQLLCRANRCSFRLVRVFTVQGAKVHTCKEPVRSKRRVRRLQQTSVFQPLAQRQSQIAAAASTGQSTARLLAAGGSEIKFLATLAFSLQSESFAHR